MFLSHLALADLERGCSGCRGSPDKRPGSVTRFALLSGLEKTMVRNCPRVHAMFCSSLLDSVSDYFWLSSQAAVEEDYQ